MNIDDTQEIWQIESGGAVYDATFAEMANRIDQGSLLKIDRVRKGNLRWIEAGKVPALLEFFNAKDASEPTAPVVTLTKLGPASVPAPAAMSGSNFSTSPLNRGVKPQPGSSRDEAEGRRCSMHEDVEAFYICDTCCNVFCRACPNSYGGRVKICPFCGAMCSEIVAVLAAARTESIRSADLGNGFGFGDFRRALAYPFKYKTSLVMGAVMYMVLSIGQGATSFGGIFMLGGALACFLCANTLTFGILANTVENFSQGKIGLNFMPTFEDFSIWDDVVHPFFLSVGVYVVSFGPLLVLIAAAFFFFASPASMPMSGARADAARLVDPELPYAANAAKQSQTVRELLQKTSEEQKKRVALLESSQDQPPAADQGDTPAETANEEEKRFENLQRSIEESRKAQLESTLGKTAETRGQERTEMIKQIIGYGFVFLLLGAIFSLWGILYFPAACAVAGYTRSFAATLNPSVGIDTIRYLGFDYLKILFMGLGIAVLSGSASVLLSYAFSPFDLPGIGNVPAHAIGSVVGFYFSIVFSCVLGYALYKAADRLKLAR